MVWRRFPAVISGIMGLAMGQTAFAAPADLVLLHGKVLTVDAHDRVAQALAVRDGRIQAVGSDRRIRRLVGPGTRVIDLHGRAATPGLIDTHAHILETGTGELFEIRLAGISSVQDILALVAKRAAAAHPGEWIVGSGWDEGKFADGRYPTAADLDKVSPDNPVWLEHTTGHYGVANSAALRLSVVSAATPTPTAGTIERLADGAPAGVLKETAQDLVTRHIPAYSIDQRRQALTHMAAALHSEGMTGYKDPAISPDDWRAYVSLARDVGFDMNACVLFSGGRTLEATRQALAEVRSARAEVAALPHTTLGVCGVKLFMDGSGAAPTAWMYKDWNRNRTDLATGNSGYPQIEPEVFRQQVGLLVEAGMGIGVHAIGDRAIDWAVDTFEAALKAHPQTGLRLSLIHANTPTDHAISVMARLQKTYDAGYPEVQPGFTWWIGDIYAANLGPERSLRLNPLHTYAARGVIWAGGSDAPVTPYAARYGLWSATARQTLKGTWGQTPFGLDESVDIHAALRAYTRVAARQIFAEKQTGSLERGKSADIAVWNLDPYKATPEAIKDMRCDLTLFRGKIAFEREVVRP